MERPGSFSLQLIKKNMQINIGGYFALFVEDNFFN
jgi:hypothetical protein